MLLLNRCSVINRKNHNYIFFFKFIAILFTAVLIAEYLNLSIMKSLVMRAEFINVSIIIDFKFYFIAIDIFKARLRQQWW